MHRPELEAVRRSYEADAASDINLGKSLFSILMRALF